MSKWHDIEVKEKENRSWPDEDKIKIYTLSRDHSASEIASMFNATVTQIHNVTRLAKKGLKQCCYHCGTPLTEEELRAHHGLVKACTRCKEAAFKYKRVRREKALKQGLCGYCETRPVVSGHTACIKCISATHRRRNKEGLCGFCGVRPVKHEGGSLCEECIKITATKTMIYREREKVCA